MSGRNCAPIALFVYNRTDHLIRTINALRANDLAKSSELFIYSDGPRNSDDISMVNHVREYLKTINGFKSVNIDAAPSNKGLAASIISGVTHLTNKYGKVIVLEDDIVTSSNFLRFMNEALDFYETTEKVMHISGYNFPMSSNADQETFFIVPATCWGWATWKRAWKHFEKNPERIIQDFSSSMIKDFNLNNANNYFLQVVLNQTGSLNTWAIFWHAAIYLNQGLSLHPVRSFCLNIGHDGSGEHCSNSSIFDVRLDDHQVTKFETNIKESKHFRKKVELFSANLNHQLLKELGTA